MDVINDADVIQIVKRMLNTFDSRLVDHGQRVTYLCLKIMNEMKVPEDEFYTAAKLALFHDIGAYKTDEVDNMLLFESNDVWEHAVYGFLFLARMSPLKDHSDCVLYHHIRYDELLKTDCSSKPMAALIHLCDRIDVAIVQGSDIDETFFKPGMFREEQVSVFKNLNADGSLLKALENGSYEKELEAFFTTIHFTEEERDQYLQMMAYSIDFNSKFTVLHTIMTTSLAIEIGRYYGFDDQEIKKLYYGTLLHDIGKGAIPIGILEKRGKLDDEEMRLMRTHVQITEAVLDGYVQEDILHMAVRHHEKLDGSGYPYHLKAEELTLCDRIVAIADILSALLGKRSYKDAYPIEKATDIIQQMADDGKLDADVVEIFVRHKDDILKTVRVNTEKIRNLYQTMTEDYEQLTTSMIKY